VNRITTIVVVVLALTLSTACTEGASPSAEVPTPAARASEPSEEPSQRAQASDNAKACAHLDTYGLSKDTVIEAIVLAEPYSDVELVLKRWLDGDARADLAAQAIDDVCRTYE